MFAFTILKLCIFVSLLAILTADAHPAPEEGVNAVEVDLDIKKIVPESLKKTFQNGLNFVKKVPEKLRNLKNRLRTHMLGKNSAQPTHEIGRRSVLFKQTDLDGFVEKNTLY